MKKKINPQALQIAGYLHDWLEKYVPSIKACSPHTKRNYKTSIALYAEYLRCEKCITPEKLDSSCFRVENITEWIIWLKYARKCTPATCNVRLSALRAFLRYAANRDVSYTECFLKAENLPNEKVTKNKVTGLSKPAVQALLATPDLSTKKGLRDYTLMLTLYSTALRINEILTLKIGNIHMDCAKPHIVVIGKGRKIRPLPLLSKPLQYIRRYLEKYHPAKNDTEALLFFSKSKGVHSPMTAENVNKLLKHYAAKAHVNCKEVPDGLHAHQFRHAKASHWLENGMNIAQISYLLGHESIQTTMIYLDITTEQEAKALETLENENQKKTQKKWKTDESEAYLESFLGLRN